MADNPRLITPRLVVSVVSHGQGELLTPLLEQLKAAAASLPMHIVVTLNLPEPRPAVTAGDNFALTCIENPIPKGFAENHNAAFAHCNAPYFCVLNPDVRVNACSLPPLLECLARRPGVAGPRVVAPTGSVEDNARQVPSPLRLLSRWWHRRFEADYSTAVPEQQVDWIAGMCMVFDRDTYSAVGGFNTSYWLYCEDVDICLKIHLQRRFVTWVQSGVVIHDAQRSSHRRWRYFALHVSSLMRLFSSATYWRFRVAYDQIRAQ